MYVYKIYEITDVKEAIWPRVVHRRSTVGYKYFYRSKAQLPKARYGQQFIWKAANNPSCPVLSSPLDARPGTTTI